MMDCLLARLLRVVVKPTALSRWASLSTHCLVPNFVSYGDYRKGVIAVASPLAARGSINKISLAAPLASIISDLTLSGDGSRFVEP